MASAMVLKVDQIDVVAPNFKRRLSGVTSTIIQLVPLQAANGLRIATLGPGLPGHLPRIQFRDLWRLWKKPIGKPARIWHARRNVEMVAGVLLRDVLRMPLRLVFTSASQRKHKWFTRFLITLMDSVIATSKKTALYLNVPHHVVMHGIDTQKFIPPIDKSAAKLAVSLNPERFFVGCFGRIRHQKGTDLFVEAMLLAMAKNPDWDAVIAGRATAEHLVFEQNLKLRVKNAGLAHRFIFAGEHTDIHRWYQAVDLFVAPQRWEGFGLTPLEAMASGLPVIVTDVGAFDDLVVEGQTGYVLPDFEPASICSKLETLMSDKKLLQRFSLAARDHVIANFELQREVDSIEKIYDLLVKVPKVARL